MSSFRAGLRPKPKSNKVDPLVFKKGNNVCNICGQKKNLTDDHVPPQCCGNDKEISARRIYAEELIARQVGAKSRNGLKFRTICKNCNGDLLGAWDDALGDFAAQAESILTSTVALPESVAVNLRAGAVLRSVLGHVVAAKVKDDQVPVDQKIRDYLTGVNILPPEIKVYCWLYPFAPTIVSRDFTFVELVENAKPSPGVVSVVKFYPLAFCIVDGHGALDATLLTALHAYSTLDVVDSVTIHLRREPVVQPGWPERPIRNHVVLGGRTYSDSVTTVTAGSAVVTPGKRIQAERWEAGDTPVFPGLHAFAEIQDP